MATVLVLVPARPSTPAAVLAVMPLAFVKKMTAIAILPIPPLLQQDLLLLLQLLARLLADHVTNVIILLLVLILVVEIKYQILVQI